MKHNSCKSGPQFAPLRRLHSPILRISIFILPMCSTLIVCMKLDDDQFMETWQAQVPKKGPYTPILAMIRDGDTEKLEAEFKKNPGLARERITRDGFKSPYDETGKVQGPTLLHYAAHQSNAEVITLLLTHHAPLNALNIYGSIKRTPLDFARHATIKALLKKRGGKTYDELIK